MIWESKFDIGARTYLRHSDDEMPGYVIQVCFDGGVSPRYLISWGDRSGTWHSEFEMSDRYVPAYSEQQQ